jgi:hypothetical protein
MNIYCNHITKTNTLDTGRLFNTHIYRYYVFIKNIGRTACPENQSLYQTCPCTSNTCLYRFAQFPSCGIFTPTRAGSVKQQGAGAGETSRTTNYELQGTGRATRAPVTQTLQTVRQTCPCTAATCLYTFAWFPSCGIFTPTRTVPVKQRVETTG